MTKQNPFNKIIPAMLVCMEDPSSGKSFSLFLQLSTKQPSTSPHNIKSNVGTKIYLFFSIYVKMSYMQQQAFEHTEREQNIKRFTKFFLRERS